MKPCRTFFSRFALGMALGLGSSAAALAQSQPWKEFAPPVGDTSVQFLRQIFGPVIDLVSNSTSGAQAAGGTIDTVLGSMMSVWCSAIIFIGMVFVAYTSIKATVNSAHDGEWLGRSMHATWVWSSQDFVETPIQCSFVAASYCTGLMPPR